MPNGSEISYMLGLIQTFTGILCTLCNILELSYQNNIQYCIVYFVALHVVMEVKNLYFESLKTNKLKEIMHHAPKVINKGSSIEFKSRTCFHKVARVVYKVIRTFYAGFLFYFTPYTVFLVQLTFEKN